MKQNSKATRRTLIASAITIALCIVLLIGTTFAWFTDSVSNKGNKIESGTLKVQLFSGDTDISESADPFFNYNLWEPGYSTGALLSVKNDGSLALKYELLFQGLNTAASKGIENVLDVYVLDEERAVEATDVPVGTVADFVSDKAFMSNDVLEAGETDKAQFVVVKMRESAGNEYQDAVVTFDILLRATQATFEEDGFGSDQYDKDATLDFVPVGTVAELTKALASGNPISLTDDIVLTASLGTLIEDVIIQGNGHTIDASLAGPNVFLINRAVNEVKIEISDLAILTTKYNNSAIAVANSTVSHINLDDVTFHGFKYGLWIANDNAVEEINVSNTDVTAWSPFYLYSSDVIVTFDNCIFDGFNKHSGDYNSFATIVIEGGQKIGTVTGNGTGNNNILTFNNCTLKANNSGDNPQNIIGFNYGASNNTVYLNNCTVEPLGIGAVVSESPLSQNNHVFCDGIELPMNQ